MKKNEFRAWLLFLKEYLHYLKDQRHGISNIPSVYPSPYLEGISDIKPMKEVTNRR